MTYLIVQSDPVVLKKEKLQVLFCGELPPVNVHGASVSNRMNLNILSEIADITIVEEKWNVKVHNQFSITKVFRNFKSILRIVGKSISSSYDLFYSVFSISLFGGAKNLLNIVTAKLMNPRVKLMIHIHRSDLIHLIEKSRLYRFYIKILNGIGTTFILLSHQQKAECRSYLHRSEVIYNCIDEDEIYPINRTIERKKIHILYISNYIREKGILDLLLAFRGLDGNERFRLDCFGATSDDQTKSGINRLSEGIDNIIIHGPVYGDEKNRVMNEADIIVLPSYNEGLSLVMLEALRLQKPIVISKRGYTVEVLGDEYPLYCEPGDIDSIRNSIRVAIDLADEPLFKTTLSALYGPFNVEEHRTRFLQVVREIAGLSENKAMIFSD